MWSILVAVIIILLVGVWAAMNLSQTVFEVMQRNAALATSLPIDADEKTRWEFLEGTWIQPRAYYVKFWKDSAGKMFVKGGTPLMPLMTPSSFPATEIKSIDPQTSVLTLIDGKKISLQETGQLITWRHIQMRKRILGIF